MLLIFVYTVRKMIYENEPLTTEQIQQIEKAETLPITFDEDCPELTEAQLAEIAAMAAKQRAERRKPIISVRVSPDTLRKAKALGKGYTSILGRLLDMAINNPEMIKKCL